MTSSQPPPLEPSKGLLEPSDRVAEVLFGLIMVLTFTGSLSVAEADRAEVRTMLIGALGCNFAWGVIDAILYLMNCLAEKGRSIRALRALRATSNPEVAHRILADVLTPGVAATLSSIEWATVREKLMQLPDPALRPHLQRNEWLAAVGVFLWVFVTTFPVAIPFLFVDDVRQAMRLSNVVAVAILFVTGYAFGRCAEYHPWLTGIAMVLLGAVLVTFTIALGG